MTALAHTQAFVCAAIALGVIAALIHLPISARPIRLESTTSPKAAAS